VGVGVGLALQSYVGDHTFPALPFDEISHLHVEVQVLVQEETIV
jgi:AMMECR1 domain-containing protein